MGGILYAKHKPDKLMDFAKMNVTKLNIPKLINACERHCRWTEAVFLHTHYDEYDSAANTMMMHSSRAFMHDQFLTIMQKISNFELYYRAIQFYFDEQPMQVNSLLNIIASKVDHARVVQLVRKIGPPALGHLPLILPYLKHVQQHNIAAVNEALNDLYCDAEQFENLRESIEEFDNFEQIALAQKLEKHDLLEMRRLAALVYRKNKRFKQSIDLSKQDLMYKDTMECARDSGNPDLAENLLRFFSDQNNRECFAACLYTCYELISPDVALELAWRRGMMDFAMPYLVQVLREYTTRLDALDKKTQKKEEAEEKKKSAPNDYVADYMPSMGVLPGMGNLAITGAPAMAPMQPFGMGPVGQMGMPAPMTMPIAQGPNMGLMPGRPF